MHQRLKAQQYLSSEGGKSFASHLSIKTYMRKPLQKQSSSIMNLLK